MNHLSRLIDSFTIFKVEANCAYCANLPSILTILPFSDTASMYFNPSPQKALVLKAAWKESKALLEDFDFAAPSTSSFLSMLLLSSSDEFDAVVNEDDAIEEDVEAVFASLTTSFCVGGRERR